MNPHKAWDLLHVFHRVFHRMERKLLRKMLPQSNQETFIPSDVRFFGYDVHIGKDVHIGSGDVFMCVHAPIILGDKVMLGPNVTMITGDHRLDCVGRYMMDIGEDEKLPENDLPIILKGDNWVGANATILKGVTVGEGAVIAAGSDRSGLSCYSECATLCYSGRRSRQSAEVPFYSGADPGA